MNSLLQIATEAAGVDADGHPVVSPSASELLAQREFNANIKPPLLRPIYTLAGHCIATCGNIGTITAAEKTGKTTIFEAMLAAAMTSSQESDCLGFASSNAENLALLHFDSEQSPDDHWRCIARAMKRAGVQKPPPWLHSYCLTGLTYKRAWECVEEAILWAADEHKGFHSMLLDGAADFVNDVNDSAESNRFVATLHGIAIEKVCPIVVAIHLNPGSDKSRGHLGSQLLRKGETNLRLDKADGITTIWSDKQRRAQISKKSGPRFAWSDERGMHVSASSRSVTKEDIERGKLLTVFKKAFSERPAMRYSELKSTVKTLVTGSDRTIERKIKRAAALGIIKATVAGLYAIST